MALHASISGSDAGWKPPSSNESCLSRASCVASSCGASSGLKLGNVAPHVSEANGKEENTSWTGASAQFVTHLPREEKL